MRGREKSVEQKEILREKNVGIVSRLSTVKNYEWSNRTMLQYTYFCLYARALLARAR